jgi:hypothetical protein
MSLLPNDTYANAGRALWAVAGSGGGGGGSTLQSPASITPAANGSNSLSVIVNSGAGQDAFLTVSNTTGNDAVLELLTTAGGDAVVTMGSSAGEVAIVAPSLAASGKLNVCPVTGGTPGVPNLTVDTVGATVTVQNLLLVGQAAFGNQAAFAPLTANTSKVTQTLAAGGSMSIGSSNANPSGLLVTDIAGGGFTNHVEVTGVAPNASLLLSGGQSANDCFIFPQVATGGILSLGSNNAANQDSVVLTDTATLINKLGGAPQVLAASGNLSPGNVTPTTAVFPGPIGEGLYCIMVASTPVSTQNSRDAQLSTMAYINAAGQCQIGGNGTTVVGAGGSLDIYPLDGTSNFFLSYTGSQQLNNISVVAFKISGPIPGGF